VPTVIEGVIMNSIAGMTGALGGPFATPFVVLRKK
jgi:hypothetical protein